MIKQYNIAMIGVGGTGILTAATILAETAIKQGENVRVGEIHGLAQRGGVVNCDVRIGDKVFGPIIMDGKADVLLSFELVETLRALKKVPPEGVIILNKYAMVPPGVSAKGGVYPNYQKVFSIAKHFTKSIFIIDALKLARKAGNPITMNIVMLGALVGINGFPLKRDLMKETIAELFRKFVDTNLKAFEFGYQELADKINEKQNKAFII